MKKQKFNDPQNLSQDLIIKTAKGAGLEGPDRIAFFESLIKSTKSVEEVNHLTLLLQRIKILGIHVDGFVPEEIIKFQNEIIRGFHRKLTDKYLIEYLRDRQRYLERVCNDTQLNPFNQNYRRLNEWLVEVINRFSKENSFLLKIQDKKIKITNEMVAGFCNLVNASTSLLRKDYKTIDIYCRRVCEVYDLTFKTKVSKVYSQKVNESLAVKIQALILPNIEVESRDKINQYINKNILNK